MIGGEGGLREADDEGGCCSDAASYPSGPSRKRQKLNNDISACSSTHTEASRLFDSPSPFPSNLLPSGPRCSLSSAHAQIDIPRPHQTTPPLNEPYHHLPHDLIISNIVASRLPLLDLVRARTICRSWRDSIFSPLLTAKFGANLDCRRPRLLVEHSSSSGPSLAVFDPLDNCWFVVPIPSFGRLVAASKGLFCYITDAGRPPSLVVGNPLTNEWKHLPKIPLSVPSHGPQLFAMVATDPAGSYRVMVLFGLWDDDATDAYLPFMYDSLSGNWTRRDTISARLSFATSRSVVKPPNLLLSVDSNAGSLLSYDINNNVGRAVELQHLPFLINEEDPKTNLWRRLPQIAVCKGTLFLVARSVGERAPEPKLGQLPIVQHSSVGIWTMQDGSAMWDFISCIPLDLLETLVKGSDGTDFIIASNGGSKLFFILKGSPHMLVYHSTLCTWTLLPGCPADYTSYPLHQSAFYEPLVWFSAL